MKTIEEAWSEFRTLNSEKDSSVVLNEFGRKLKEQLTLTTLPLRNDPLRIDSVVPSNYPNMWSLAMSAVLSGYIGGTLIYSVNELRSIPHLNMFFNLMELTVTEYTFPTITPNLQDAKTGNILFL